jgi:hypothetical protein
MKQGSSIVLALLLLLLAGATTRHHVVEGYTVVLGRTTILGNGISKTNQHSVGRRTTTTSIGMGGFLEGRMPKNDIMKREDDAMWVEDDEASKKDGGQPWNPFTKSNKNNNNNNQKAAGAGIAPSLLAAQAPKRKVVASTTNKKKTTGTAPSPTATPPKKNGNAFKMPWDKN